MDTDASQSQEGNPLYSKSSKLDSGLLLSVLVDLLNCKPLACVALPDFRIEQLLCLAARRVTPVTERKLLESLCALYVLCLYYALSTDFKRDLLFEFLSLVQALQAEALMATHSSSSSHKLQMPPLDQVLRKDPAIEVDYKLEVFSESLLLGKLIARDLHSCMRVVFRVGGGGLRNAPLALTPEEKRKLLKYVECLQPYSVYFMCGLAYSHVAVVLHSGGSVNIVPGSLESVVLMLLTQPTPPLPPKEGKGKVKTTSQQGEGDPAPTPVRVGLDAVMKCAHKLALFCAHVLFDDRSLQEVRMVHARLLRHVDHPDAAYAQFRTSTVKALLLRDRLPPPHAPHTQEGQGQGQG
eukprot:CAMPEP_0173325732 /NCGR_PEP_ID=MMETSP1144-20121109/682_1 /TAXON_ID=483371 /ORGANISM="non described non described, Strain CCMP2298" /LENGTH=351 /DNA_ID=CAMNT_0014269981 /DNA_START=91 /DNA_END=1142 /DNA_ORIENTATION=+